MIGLKLLPPTVMVPPHKVTRESDVIDLAEKFYCEGWDSTKPALVGYKYFNKIQLLSGTHRHAAALLADLESIPVVVFEVDEITDAWGKPEWDYIMSAGDRKSDTQ